MNFSFNGNTPENINYNGQEVLIVKYNGEIVWQKGSIEPPIIIKDYDYQVADSVSLFNTSLNIPYAYSYDEKKWYVLNNANLYEQYGLYEETDNINSITTYPNKLAVVGTTEYQYQNNNWVEVGTYENGFGEIGELSQESFPSGSQFPLNFALKKSDLTDWFDLYIDGGNVMVGIQKNGSGWDYIISDWSIGYNGIGTVTEDDEYVYFNKPEDYESDTFEVMNLMWWDMPITMYGGSTVASVKYDKTLFDNYSTIKGWYYEKEEDVPTNLGYNQLYNLNGYIYANGERSNINPYINNPVFKNDTTLKTLKIYDDCITELPTEFAKESQITSIDIKSPITVFSTELVYQCSNLTSVTIPNSVTSIGARAFSWCPSITSITIPDSVTSIDSGAFQNCECILSVGAKGSGAFIEIPSNVSLFNNSLFSGCHSLTSVTIPDSVTSIGGDVFAYCNTISSLTIPDSVTSIGSRAFYNCSKLTSITIPDSVTSIGSNAFNGCSKLTSITIPHSVTSIGTYAFASCSSLTSVTWNSSQQYIQSYTFYYCSKLQVIDFSGGATQVMRFGTTSTSTTVGTNNYIPTTIQYIVVPDNLYDSWRASTYWSNYTAKIISKSSYDAL